MKTDASVLRMSSPALSEEKIHAEPKMHNATQIENLKKTTIRIKTL